MNIVLSESQFNIENMYFMEPIVNTIIDNSMFIKILYSNKLVTLNGLFLNLNINITNNELYFKKIKYTYDITNLHNKTILNKIYSIESNILDKYMCSKPKTKKYSVYETMKTGVIKIFPNAPNIHNHSINHKNNNVFLLKISGIWENETEYGLTYKLSTS